MSRISLDIGIVLWKKESGAYSLLAYKLLIESDVVIENGELKPWSTIIVQVFEVDDSGRENRIFGYIQGTGSYPRNTINWNYGNFVALTNIQPFPDSSLTSSNFEALRPAEIGIHAYYDSPASNDQFFDNFAMNVLSSSGSVLVNPIQY